MLLYTIQPAELIFPTNPDDYQYTTVKAEGQWVMGVRHGDTLQITRLLSTDPKMYLDPRFSPGREITIDQHYSDYAAL